MSERNNPNQHPQYPAPQGRSWVRRHKFLTSLIAFGALVGMDGILQATGQDKSQVAPAPTVTVTATASAKAAVKASAAAAVTASAKKSFLAVEPTFAYPGNWRCAIVYRGNGNGTMSWTATVTIAGELFTHASDSAGNIYRRDARVSPGWTVFTAPVSLPKIDDIGGALYAGNTSYGCSIAPQRASSAPARTAPAAKPAPIASTAQTGCHPLTDGGNCYEPGEYCRTADQGTSGVAGDGEAITCEYNNGLRWEPS